MKTTTVMAELQIFTPDAKQVAVHETSHRIVETLSNSYRDVIAAMVGKSENTKKTYTRNAEHFLAYIQQHGINAHTFGQYRNALESVDVAVKTKNAYLAAARALCREALKYNILPVDITSNVPAFKTPRGHVKDGLSASDVRKVAQHIAGIENPAKRLKMACFYHLFVLEGLRQMEAANITAEDFNPEDGFLLIRGKWRHDKEKFYIMPATVRTLKAYMEAEGITAGYIFPSPTNPGEPITTRAVRKIFTCPKYGIFTRAGVDGKSVHGFRHFNITHTLEVTGGDIGKTVQRARLKTVETVITYNDSRLNKANVDELSAAFGNMLI